MKHSILVFALLLIAPGLVADEVVSVRPFSEVGSVIDRQAAARVISLNEAVLSAEITARLVEVQAEVGQSVQAGQLLLRLDPDSLLIERDRALAQLELAEAGYDLARLRAERARRLAPNRFVSEDQLLEAETILRQVRAEQSLARQSLATAELMLSKTRISAPFDGVVTARMIGQGALATPGAPLIELVSSADLEIVANVGPALAAGLEAAAWIEFIADGQAFEVELDRIAGVIGRGSRTRESRLRFADRPALTGSEGIIRWQDPRLALPPSFLLERDGLLGVLVLSDDGRQAEFLPLPGADAGRPFPIDLPAELLLIDRGRQRLVDGDRVRVEP